MTTRMAEPNEGADYLMELNAEQRSAATAIGNGGLGRKMRFDDLPNVRQWQSNRITVTSREKEVLRMDRGAGEGSSADGSRRGFSHCKSGSWPDHARSQGDTRRSATGSRCRAGKTNCDAIPGLPGLWRGAQGEGFPTRCISNPLCVKRSKNVSLRK